MTVKITGKITFEDTEAPTVTGDIGVDVVTGRVSYFDGAVARTLANTAEAAGGGAIEVKDEGGTLTPTAASLDFVGDGVMATTIGNNVTVTIPASGFGPLVNGATTDSAYSRVVKGLSPYLYWRLDEYTGTTARDEAGVNDGTVVDNVQINPLRLPTIGGAFRFNVAGTLDGRVEAVVTDFPLTPVSVAVWIRADAPGAGQEFFHYSTAANDFEFLITNLAPTSLQITIQNIAGTNQLSWASVDGVPNLRDGAWHFVVFTWDPASGSAVVYVDGVSKGGKTFSTGALSGSSGEVWIGHSQKPVGTPRVVPNPTAEFIGDMDEAAIFPSIITAQNVSDLYLIGNDERRVNLFPQLVREVQLLRTIGPGVTEELTADSGTPGPGNRVFVPPNTALACKALITARDVTTGDAAAYMIWFSVKRATTLASTAIVGTPTVVVITEDDPSWDVSATADVVNGSIQINGIGDATNTTRWTCQLTTVETSQ